MTTHLRAIGGTRGSLTLAARRAHLRRFGSYFTVAATAASVFVLTVAICVHHGIAYLWTTRYLP